MDPQELANLVRYEPPSFFHLGAKVVLDEGRRQIALDEYLIFSSVPRGRPGKSNLPTGDLGPSSSADETGSIIIGRLEQLYRIWIFKVFGD